MHKPKCFTGKHHFIHDTFLNCDNCTLNKECSERTITKLYTKIVQLKNTINRKLTLKREFLKEVLKIKQKHGYGPLNQRIINETREQINILEAIKREEKL